MIFVTVGTHEGQFNRLVSYMDKVANKLDEEVIIQTGYSMTVKNAIGSKFFSFEEMNALVNRARIVITHGGPSSFIAPLRLSKIPIVVPRLKKFGEHINDHQLSFCEEVARRNKNIILVTEIEELLSTILNYEKLIQDMKFGSSNSSNFIRAFEKVVEKVIWEERS